MNGRLATYAMSGALGTAVHYAAMAALLPITPPVLASTLGALAGGAANYHLARRRIFPGPVPVRRSAPRFVIVALAGMALNAAVLHALAPLFGVLAAQFCATLCVLLGGFAANRRWTFGARAA